jgi:hypothetical protein
MNEPAMPTLLVARYRPGFYLRVLEEGLVKAGDDPPRALNSIGPDRLRGTSDELAAL